MNSADSQVQWQVPSALTHATWQAAHADCQAQLSLATTAALALDWSLCKQVDSSALAFILDLKRCTLKPIRHLHTPVQLLQLAKLYEVDAVLGLPYTATH